MVMILRELLAVVVGPLVLKQASFMKSQNSKSNDHEAVYLVLLTVIVAAFGYLAIPLFLALFLIAIIVGLREFRHSGHLHKNKQQAT
jgi:hypothetical protein